MRLRSGSFELREFDASLTDTVYTVRNHPSVRAHLRDPRPIDREKHERWVQENLLRARQVHLFVVFQGGEPAGIALLRNFRGREAEVGLMIVEPQRRRLAAYVAGHLIAYYAFDILGLERLSSLVPLHNRPALEFNRRCGFEPAGPPSEIYHLLFLSRRGYASHPTHKRFRGTRRITIEPSKS